MVSARLVSLKIDGSTSKILKNMKTIKLMPLLVAGLLVVLMTSCGPAYVNTGVGYGPRPYYNNYGYRPYGYYRPAPPVVVRPRYYAPAPRYYSNPNARRGYGGGYSRGGGRSRGPR